MFWNENIRGHNIKSSKSSNHLLFKIQPLLDLLYFMVITNQFINDQMTRCVRPLQSLDENICSVYAHNCNLIIDVGATPMIKWHSMNAHINYQMKMHINSTSLMKWQHGTPTSMINDNPWTPTTIIKWECVYSHINCNIYDNACLPTSI